MIYYTGDIHGSPKRILKFSRIWELTEDDTIVILGDVGANYYRNSIDEETKSALAKVKATIFCIHGNHECRPEHIPSYIVKEWKGGKVWYEDEYPNLLFAKDGEIFEIEGIRHLVIGGAYSIDKHYRLARGAGWWSDEQPSDEIKVRVEEQVKNGSFDIILSHTCPYKFRPLEKLLSGYDQSKIDDSTERWLDEIENKADYKAWLCGHWHTDKHIDRMYFLFEKFIIKDQIVGERS